jgi:hypothetical protein
LCLFEDVMSALRPEADFKRGAQRDAMCHSRHFAPRQDVPLFNHFVGAHEH